MRNKTTSILITAKGVDSNIWHYKLGHLREKEMKILHSKGKFSGLKALDLKF